MVNNTNNKSFVINLIAGPGAGKSVMASLIFATLKIKGHTCEYIQEYAKSLVWTKDFTTLNDQYYISNKQFNILNEVNGCVDYIITDGSLYHGLYYNRFNKDNTSNIEKTEKFILNCCDKFNNINIFLDRANIEYENIGRTQTELQAKRIDIVLKHILEENNIPYHIFQTLNTINNLDDIIDFILKQSNNNEL
jgi:hypothetical protein